MKKKFLSAMLSFVFLFAGATAVTACGGNTDGGVSGGDSTPEVEIDDATIFGTEDSEGLAYVLSKDETYYLVSGLGECKDTKVVIPATYKNRPVRGVAEGNSQAGAGAFEGCQTLESVVLPNGATTIGAAAFASCRNLLRVSIPDSIEFIEETAFKGCSALVYNEYENGKYLGNKTNPYTVLAGGKTTSITACSVHKDAVMIAAKAFNKHTALASVTFENKNGWTAGGAIIASADLENTATAASYLTGDYCAKIWLCEMQTLKN